LFTSTRCATAPSCVRTGNIRFHTFIFTISTSLLSANFHSLLLAATLLLVIPSVARNLLFSFSHEPRATSHPRQPAPINAPAADLTDKCETIRRFCARPPNPLLRSVERPRAMPEC